MDDLSAHPATDPPPRGAVSGTARPESHLVDDTTAEHYRQLVATGSERVARNIAHAAAPWTGASPDEVAAEVSKVDLDRPLEDAEAALDELQRIYLRDAVYFHHPRYLAHLNCPVVAPALLGETVLAAINSSLDTWDQSAVATYIERRLIEWTARRVGLGERADGVFTSGGTQSNLQALLLARDEACHHACQRAYTTARLRDACGSSPPSTATSA